MNIESFSNEELAREILRRDTALKVARRLLGEKSSEGRTRSDFIKMGRMGYVNRNHVVSFSRGGSDTDLLILVSNGTETRRIHCVTERDRERVIQELLD